MSGYNGNFNDGFESLLAETESDKANVVGATQVVVPVETQVDVPVIQDSPKAVVAPQPVIETPVLRQEHSQPTQPVEDWEHKFKTLQGMHQADNGKAKELQATLQSQLEAEKSARVSAEQELAKVPLNYQEIMGEEAYEDLGEGTVDGIAKLLQAERAKAESASNVKIAQLESIIGNLQDGFEKKNEDEVAYKEENEGILHDQRVTAEVPEFLSLVKDEAFAEWLNGEVDAISGSSLLSVFDQADQNMNSGYVANICKIYLGQKEAREANAYDKTEHVAPTMNSQTPQVEMKPIMYWSEYNKITDKLMNRQISEQEFSAFNKAFELAKQDGRVQ